MKNNPYKKLPSGLTRSFARSLRNNLRKKVDILKKNNINVNNININTVEDLKLFCMSSTKDLIKKYSDIQLKINLKGE